MVTNSRLRRLAPPSGLPYELFDAAVLVFGLAMLWYVTTAPSAPTVAALSDTLALILAPQAWGYGMATTSALAAGLAYGSRRAVLAGYVLLAAATTGWAVSLVLGVVVATWSGDIDWQVAGKALGVALVYAWATRRILTVVLREGDTAGMCR